MVATHGARRGGSLSHLTVGIRLALAQKVGERDEVGLSVALAQLCRARRQRVHPRFDLRPVAHDADVARRAAVIKAPRLVQGHFDRAKPAKLEQPVSSGVEHPERGVVPEHEVVVRKGPSTVSTRESIDH